METGRRKRISTVLGSLSVKGSRDIGWMVIANPSVSLGRLRQPLRPILGHLGDIWVATVGLYLGGGCHQDRLPREESHDGGSEG